MRACVCVYVCVCLSTVFRYHLKGGSNLANAYNLIAGKLLGSII